MVTLDWETERTDGVTLVRLYVTSEYRRRVRVENRLDGPVWPPRREGQPAAGWDGDAFEGVVTPDDRLVAGYATSAPPADPPAEVVSEESVDPETPPGPVGHDGFDPVGADGRLAATDGGGGAGATTSDEPATSGGPGGPGGPGGQFRNGSGDASAESPADEPTPEAVVRTLGDPVVPRQAVPVPDADDGNAGGDDTDRDDAGEDGTDEDEPGTTTDTSSPPSPAESERSDDETEASDGSDDTTGESETEGQQVTGDRDDGRSGVGPDGATPPGTDAELVVPGAVRAWLCDVDRRLSAVERRREAETADPDPTLQVAAAGDRRALECVAERVESLTGRAAAVERRAGSDGRR